MTSEGSSLCRGCGLCCDGTLFSNVELLAAEIAPARRRGLAILEIRGTQRFSQPCPHHQGSSCAVYPERPDACAKFHCALLDKLTTGELSLEECQSRVDRVKALARSILAAIPAGGERRSLRAEIEAHLTAEGGPAAAEEIAWRRKHADLLMDLKGLEILTKRDFIPPLC